MADRGLRTRLLGRRSLSAAQQVYALDPLKDSRHRAAQSARDLEDWKAFLEVGNKAARTLDSYERYAAALMRAFPQKRFDEFTDGDLLQGARADRLRAAVGDLG